MADIAYVWTIGLNSAHICSRSQGLRHHADPLSSRLKNLAGFEQILECIMSANIDHA